jgi:gas vesicle protein
MFSLSACGGGSDIEVRPTPAATQSELANQKLVSRANAMQKTILQGAVAGAATGAGISALLDDDTIPIGSLVGLSVGATAGTYVALIQRRYSREEKRLEAIKEDLDKNAAEMQTTIDVMQRVLATQKLELAEAKAEAAAGRISSTQLQQEVNSAQANLSEMERAISGATGRQAEFGSVRGLVPAGPGSAIDPELADLSQQIATMRSIANDLATSL